MTAWISSSVAVGFITIIMGGPLWCLEQYESELSGFHPTGGFFGARLGGGVRPLVRRGPSREEAGRLAKSPGVCVGVRVATEHERHVATGTHRARFVPDGMSDAKDAWSASTKRSFSASVPTVTRSERSRP